MAKKRRQKINNSGIDNLATIVEKADKCFNNGEYDKTASLCREAIDRFGDKISKQSLSKIYFTWVLTQIKLNDYEPIEKLIEQAQSRIGKYLDLTVMNVMAAYGSGDYKKTIHWVEKYANEHKLTDPNAEITPKDGAVVRVGKRKFAKLRTDRS